MRLAVCTLSAVLLSGCSWLGGVGNVFNGGGQGHHAKSSHYQYGGGHHRQHQYQAQRDPCQVFSPKAPIPQGCHPSQVTLGTAGGFPQQPSFGVPAQGRGQYASQGYGSHAGVAHQQAAHYGPRKSKKRKPRFRGALSLGAEKSISGGLLDYTKLPTIDPVAGYNPQDYREARTTGSEATGNITTVTWTANQQELSGTAVLTPPGTGFLGYERARNPEISFDDVYSTPTRLAGGFEYIVNPKTTFFANAGYSQAEGKSGQVASIDATLYRLTESQDYQPEDPGVDAMGNPNPPTGNFVTAGGLQRSTSFIPNEEIARFNYDFTDMKRLDLEAGGRYYFNPLVKSQGYKTLTPFVGAAVGASHYNAVSYDSSQTQRFYERAFESGENDYYEIVGPNTRVDLYDSQWVPSGQLNAGMEWQVTPKSALAFETGVRVEGARKYSNGERGDKNIAIPMTIRGSYNF